MTYYTVVWVQSAEDELVEIWMDGPDKNEISTATNAIDLILHSNAESKGSELSEGLRTLHCSPLRVIFSVRPADRIVEVVLVRRI